MSKDDFIRRFRVRMAGWGLYGVHTECVGGPLVRASRALDIPAEAEKFLGELFDAISPVPAEKNGQWPAKTPTVGGVR